MADEIKAVTTKSVVTATPEQKAANKAEVTKAQADYRGKSQGDRVEVTIKKAGTFAKEGQVLKVHPSIAMIFEKKGLIDKGWEKGVKTYNAPDSGTSLKP